MSEKRAKAALKAYYKPCVTNCQCPACRTVESIIAADPDVVRARWRLGDMAAKSGRAKEEQGDFGTFAAGRKSAFDEASQWLERVFGFRLTDEPPGWVWADDGFQDPEQWDKPDCMP